MIRLARPAIGAEALAAVQAVLESGMLVQGAEVAAFEAEFAARHHAPHAVAVANCTAALHLALVALDVGAGARVAVPTYSWPSTANAVRLAGAWPVFVDIDPALWAMDPEQLVEVLRRDGPVAAILPVHPFGAVAPLGALAAVAAAHGAVLVEDAACAIGVALDGQVAGTVGRVGCFSFHPRKVLTTGEGGMCVTADAALARRLRILRNHGLDPDAATPDFVEPGHNLRLTEMAAALGRRQLADLDGMLARRRTLAEAYHGALAPLGLTPQRAIHPAAHAWQAYVTLLPRDLGPHRPAIIAALRERGVEATIGTYHQPLLTTYRASHGHRPGDFPVTDDVAARALALPLHPGLAAGDVATVAGALAEALDAVREAAA